MESMKEILALKEKIREKEDQLKKTHQKSLSQPSLYTNYNKIAFDRLQEQEKKRMISSTLAQQLEAKSLYRLQETQNKLQQVRSRLDSLNRMKEDQERSLLQKGLQFRAYKEDLDAQQYLKSKIVLTERAERKSPLPIPEESPVKPEPFRQGLHSLYLTKRQPKTLCFNPITGSLQDTSNFLNGKFPKNNSSYQLSTHENLFLPSLKNRDPIPVEFSNLKAFQQPKFTKLHPKFVRSFPITGGDFYN
jgi:hypothetical protein